ncbi:MAG: hypothetical protein EOM03_17420 [Clostridia bacterium]|nr:hypothetical protein [Clostridia bacterium]
MASFYDTTIGQQVEFHRVLASAGFTDSDIARIIKEPNLAATMYASIQPRLVANVPSWYVSPEQQLERARQLWPNAVLPESPKEFTPRTKSEVLLLHVPDSFDNLWNLVNAPEGYTKYHWDGVKSDKRNLRLAPNKVEFTEPVWLAFDPEHGKGERPDSFWGQANVAASEVFSALIQFPKWSLAWFNGASAPNLSGYQLKYDGNWSRVPYLGRWGGDRQLEPRGRWAGLRDGHWSSPSFREC